MDLAGRIRRLRLAVRRRERLAVAVYLAVTAAALAFTCAPALRDPVLQKIEWWIVRSGDRWALRVDAAEAALAEARAVADPTQRREAIDAVAARIERLDRDHPAPTVRYARDAERVRLLRLRVEAYVAADRKGAALDAARRLVAFDPRRYRSHLLHAETALAFGEEEEARQAFEALLTIHPNHLPSVESLVTLRADAGDWAGATAVFERYLQAFWLEPVEVRLGGGASVQVHVPVDGAWHVLDLPRTTPGPARGVAVEAMASVPLETAEASLAPALRAGEPGRPQDAPAGRARLRVRLRKPVGPSLWATVERSYRNQLAWEGLEAARSRTAVVSEDGA